MFSERRIVSAHLSKSEVLIILIISAGAKFYHNRMLKFVAIRFIKRQLYPLKRKGVNEI